MKAQELTEMERTDLIGLVGDLQSKLKDKEKKLHQTRLKLSRAKARLRTMKETLNHQRSRILELYNGDKLDTARHAV
jgi:predicted MPP superfamily phosphohydrolase